VQILNAILLLSLAAVQRPHTHSERLLPMPAWVPADVSMDACPAFTHLHALGTSIPDDPKYVGDGKCHSDDTDAPLLPESGHDRVMVIPRGTRKMKPSSKAVPPGL
jgi:hypothetical protein